VARRRGIEDDDVPFIGVDVLDQQVERCDLVAAGRRAARKEFLDLRVRERLIPALRRSAASARASFS